MSDSPNRSIIELPLSPQQVAALKSLVFDEPREPVLFVAAAPHLVGDSKYWRFQVERLTQKQATKLIKLLRDPEKPSFKGQEGDEKH